MSRKVKTFYTVNVYAMIDGVFRPTANTFDTKNRTIRFLDSIKGQSIHSILRITHGKDGQFLYATLYKRNKRGKLILRRKF